MDTIVSTPIKISPVDAIWAIIQSQTDAVKNALYQRVEAEHRRNENTKKNILRQIEELEDGPAGFLKLDSILPPSKMSIKELREEAYLEKYGI
jgi:hypothetical protein